MNSNTTLEEVWALFRETDRKMQETFNRLAEEARERQREAEQRQRETDRQLRELGKEIGGLGNKFGSFTEGLALRLLGGSEKSPAGGAHPATARNF
jgi:hypothetical protein